MSNKKSKGRAALEETTQTQRGQNRGQRKPKVQPGEKKQADEKIAQSDPRSGQRATNRDITERKQAQEKVIASEIRYRRLFEAARDGILILDAETGMIVDVNPFLVEMLGFSHEAFLGKKIWELGFFKDIVANKEKFLELQRKEYVRYEELPLETVDGRRIQVEFVSNVYTVDHRKVIQCNIRDNTEHKLADKRAEDTIRSLARFPAENPNPVLRIARDGNLLYANEAAFLMLTDWKLEVGKPAPEALKGPTIEIFETQTTKMVEIPCGERTFSIAVAPARGGEYVNLYGRDITVRVQAEAALRESEERYRTVADYTYDWEYWRAPDGKILFMSPSCERITGYRAGEFMENPGLLDAIVHPDDDFLFEQHESLTQQNEGEPSVHETEFRILRKDGGTRWIGHTCQIIHRADGTSLGRRATNRDVTERKRANEALRESENKYRELIDGMNETVWVIDFNGNLVDVNKTTVEVLGYSKEELLTVGLYGIDSSLRKEDIIALANAMPLDKLQIFETTHTTKDGRTFPVEVYSSLVTYQGKRAILSIARDITERKQAEEKLEEERILLRTLIDNLPDRVYVKDVQGRKIISNITDWQASGGKTMEDVIGKTDFDTYPPELAEDYWAFDKTVLDSGISIINREEPGLDSQGNLIWVLSSKVPLRDGQGKVVGLVGIGRDITERKRAEVVLRESEERFRSILDNIEGGYYYEVDTAGNFTFVNPALVRMLGRPANELMGMNYRLYMTPEGGKAIFQTFNRVFRTGIPERAIEWDLVRPDGTLRSVEVSVSLIKAADGSINGFRGTVYDITERKRAEEKTRRRAEEFAALYETARDLADWQEIPVLLQTVVERARALLQAQYGGMYLYDPARQELENVVATDLSIPTSVRMRLGEGMAGRIAQSNQPLIVGDYRTWEGRSPQYEGIPISATVGVPMLHGGELVGVLLVHEGEESAHKFNEEDARLLSLFAGQAANAVYNARLLAETRRRLAELEVLYENSLALSGLLDTKAIGQKVIDVMAKKLAWRHATIRLYHPEDETFELLAFSQPEIRDEAEQRVIEERFNALIARPGQGLSGWVFQHGKAVRCSDVSKDDRYVETYPGLRSGLYVPLKVGERVVGVISVESEKYNAFEETDETLLETLAAQAAIAIQNARLYQEALLASERRAVLHRSGQDMVRVSQDLEQVYASTHQTASQLMPSEVFTIALLDEERHEIEAAYLFDKGGRWPPQRIPVDKGFSSRVISSGEAILIKDLKEESLEVVHFGTEESVRSVLAVPMRSSGRVIGAISVQSYKADVYSEEDCLLLEMLAAQVAIAIENARLYAETRQRLAEMEAVNRVSTALRAARNLEEMLPITLDETLNLLKADVGAVWLFDANAGKLEQVTARGWQSQLPHVNLQPGQGIIGHAFDSNEIYVSADYHSDPYLSPENCKYVPANWGGICVPLRSLDEPIGIFIISIPSSRQLTNYEINLLNTISEMAGNSIRRAALYEQTERQVQRLAALREIDMAISSNFDLRVTLNIVLNHILTQLKVDAADVLLLNPFLQSLDYTAGQGFRTQGITRSHLRLGEEFAGKAALEHKFLHIPDLTQESGFVRLPLLAGENFIGYYAVPLVAKGQVKGVLEVFHRAPLLVTEEWTRFLESLGRQAAIAIDSSQLFENLQRSNFELAIAYDATIEGWSKALDLRDRETEGHTQRVTKMTLQLARTMGVSETELVHIHRGALLHDIGKMGVPDSILLKPDKLTSEEWEIMRRHPQLAYEMLSPVSFLRPALDIPYCHHEKWDGTGYPRGLKGEEIPLSARTFAVVDVYDALTSDRPYRQAWSKAKALEYIREQSGQHFDPQVVETFLQIQG